MTADQLLQEAIIDLQKRDLPAQTRCLVDEAAQLLADGRDIEARALVEKAQAIAGLAPAPNGSGGPAAAGKMAQTIIARISRRLAEEIAGALSEAVEDLQVHFGAQVSEAARSIEDRLAEITSRLKAVSDLHDRVERIELEQAASASMAQEQWERLSVSVGSLQEMDRARRAEAEQLGQAVSAELEHISSRVVAQEERLQVLAGLVQDLTYRVSTFTQQMDRQNGMLRALQEHQSQRAAALNAVLDGFARLREPETLASQSGTA